MKKQKYSLIHIEIRKVMKAINLRALAKAAVKDEIDSITEQILTEAGKGKTRLVIEKISQGAAAYFKDEGYGVGIIGTSEEYLQVIINW